MLPQIIYIVPGLNMAVNTFLDLELCFAKLLLYCLKKIATHLIKDETNHISDGLKLIASVQTVI